MTWEELVKAMADEGYGWIVSSDSRKGPNVVTGTAWNGDGKGTVSVYLHNPVEALELLLRKCRERWSPKHPWDDLSLPELLTAARFKDWQPSVFWNTRHRAWCAATFDGEMPTCNVNAPAIALREAMKRREKDEAK